MEEDHRVDPLGNLCGIGEAGLLLPLPDGQVACLSDPDEDRPVVKESQRQ